MSKRKLGEQWAEKYKGKQHIVKCVAITRTDYPQDNHWSDGYFFDYSKKYIGTVSYYEIIKAKDLGPVNAEGLLKSTFGEYPEIVDYGDSFEIYSLYRDGNKVLKAEYAYGNTFESTKDEWNRRA